MELSKILAPVVFSENCRGAARYAAALADRFDSELLLLYVSEPMESFLGLEPGFTISDVARVRNEALIRELDNFYLGEGPRHGKVRRFLLEGDPATEIVRCANREGAGLIVMPTRGFGPFRRFLMGSTTAKVLHDSSSAVWTGVHLEQAPPPGEIAVRRIVSAVDLGPQTSAVLHWSRELAERWNAGLTIVHALLPIDDPDWRERAQGSASEELENWKRDARLEADVRVVFGEPSESVCRTAAGLEADLLVIGRGHGCGGSGRLPSRAYSILRQAGSPVISV